MSASPKTPIDPAKLLALAKLCVDAQNQFIVEVAQSFGLDPDEVRAVFLYEGARPFADSAARTETYRSVIDQLGDAYSKAWLESTSHVGGVQ